MKIKTTLILSLAVVLLLVCVFTLASCDVHFHEYSDASCEEPKTCSCGKTKGEELGHDYENATCYSPETCTRCGKTNGAPLGHDYERKTVSSCQQQNVCRRCSNVGTTYDTHQYDYPTCTTSATCVNCGATKGSALGHNYTEATCTEAKKCTRCSATVGSELGHDYAPATCTSPQLCRRCDEAKGVPNGHDYKEANCFDPQICKNCGNVYGNALGHKYADNECIRCGQTDPDSLPVPLENLTVIASDGFYWVDNLTDTYGNKYSTALKCDKNISGNSNAYSTHNLNRQYSVLKGSVVVPDSHEGSSMTLEIYVDDVLVESFENINRETEKIDFIINIKNALKVKFVVCGEYYYSSNWEHLAIVNAELTK